MLSQRGDLMKYFLLIILTFSSSFAALLNFEKNLIDVYKNSVPSVVNVTNIQTVGNPFFGFVEKIPAGQGSGFVWDNDGHIVTNFHVVDNGEDFKINFYNDKKSYKAKIVGVSPRHDIAVVKLIEKPKTINPIKVGKSSELNVGQYSVAIGNPFGLDHSMSVGIISALGRKILGVGNVKIHDMIQTDAAINQGNSGGPLMNSSGEVIGMNTMIFSPSGGNAGLGFAVPIDTINRIVPQLIANGKIVRPSLGIQVLPDQTKERFFGEKGVAIEAVVDGSPADRSGLRGMSRDRRGRLFMGDLILKIDKKEVNSFDEIVHAIENYKVGDTVDVKVRRDDKDKTFKVKLEAL
jgi:S1-C subfamily serine protease